MPNKISTEIKIEVIKVSMCGENENIKVQIKAAKIWKIAVYSLSIISRYYKK